MNDTRGKGIHGVCLSILAVLIALCCIASPAKGHMLWLNASDYSPRVGETVTLEIGFGHKYPQTEAVKDENVERILLRDPKGQELPVERVSPGKYTFKPESEGVHDVIVALKPGFVSNTTEGHKMGNKKTLPNAVSCFGFSMNAKALINVGSKGIGPSLKGDLPLEILVPENVNGLKVGDELLLKVLYQGNPVGGVRINAVDENTALQEEGKWVQESESDSRGMVRMKLISKGPWLINAVYELPYPDQTECDKSMYRTAVTFDIE